MEFWDTLMPLKYFYTVLLGFLWTSQGGLQFLKDAIYFFKLRLFFTAEMATIWGLEGKMLKVRTAAPDVPDFHCWSCFGSFLFWDKFKLITAHICKDILHSKYALSTLQMGSHWGRGLLLFSVFQSTARSYWSFISVSRFEPCREASHVAVIVLGKQTNLRSEKENRQLLNNWHSGRKYTNNQWVARKEMNRSWSI